MQRRLGDARDKLMESIVARAEVVAPESFPGDVGDFIRQYYRHVPDEDLNEREPADLAGAALAHLSITTERKLGRPALRVYNPRSLEDGWESTHTVVEMVNDDMPFLVDSIGMVLNGHGLTIHLAIHPVLNIRRDEDGRLIEVLSPDEVADDARAESFVAFEFDRETSDARLKEIRAAILQSMRDVRAAAEDWPEMRERARAICSELEDNPPPLSPTEVNEAKALLKWMENHHFTFLGYREYRLNKGEETDRLEAVPDTGLGILRGNPRTPVVLLKNVRRQARARDLLILTKANSVATVHRPGYLDYVGVKLFDSAGRVCGEKRFLGLFTSVAYSRSPRDIPLLRHKVKKVLAHFKLPPTSHDAKALTHILDTFPRDELFQSSIEDLIRIAGGIFHLQERQRVRLFIRRDAFRRFYSCLVYVPRERYNTQIRKRIERILVEDLKGEGAESTPLLSESVLARVHIIVRTSPDKRGRPNINAIEDRIADAVRTWQDGLREVMVARFGEERGLKLFRRYADSFSAAYREDVSPREASFDLERMDALDEDEAALKMSLYRPQSFPPDRLRFKTFHLQEPLPISDVLPILEDMGLRVISEVPYSVSVGEDTVIWIQDFEMECPGACLNPTLVAETFQHTFENVWRGNAENDGFNRLVLGARLSWRETAMLRAYCRYLLQTGLPFSQQYMEQVLAKNAPIARLIVKKFAGRFDPQVAKGGTEDHELASELASELDEALEEVLSLDEDRILRAYRAVIRATLRTNFFQTDERGLPKAHISFKLDPTLISDLPLPRPQFEVFVYSPRVEGVHLRGGFVARGGLRWSDRREDFRTEVLGLMKAQGVKNTMIVPVGAKGGFVAKRLPTGGREEIQAEVVSCYSTFIRGLLDVTDNIVDEKVIAPKDVVCIDKEDDAYLVVAADKGTATFSDIANEVAQAYDFWLGDAFASGGSNGYDHKKMGITARGAWEAVKRHFREIGIDVQSHDFTVAGIGDMSGDVFGNGMLLSRHIKLRAAFNHLHIFLDPDPDPGPSFEERQRLFDLPRSSWEDYDGSLITAGGGVYSRQSKSIELTPEVKAMLGVGADAMTPQELIKAILRMPVDLLWNGGIGTYVKSSWETQSDAGDRANDAVRVDANKLRCQVIGEGGNLGFTRLARVEFALNGGRINTDFIDNSGGVDCSDREVNIKILLSLVARDRRMTLGRRNKLLEAMTDEVAELVLRNNYLQTQAISMMETHAVERINEHAQLLHWLERNTDLDRRLEFLPADDDIAERRASGKGFTRPELAVIMSYSKITLYSSLLESNVPEDPYLALELRRYFPAPLQRRYADLMSQHPLSREIIATAITNSLINRMGSVFALRTQEETGADAAAIARAYTIAREVFDIRTLWTDIEALDNTVHANVQYSMMFQTTRLLRHSTYWFLGHHRGSLEIENAVSALRPGISALVQRLPDLLVGRERKRCDETARLYMDIGVSESIARRMASLNAMYSGLDIVEQAQQSNVDLNYVAGVYFALGHGLNLDWIRDQIEHLKVEGHWQAVARGSMRDNLYVLQRALTAQLIHNYASGTPSDSVLSWLEKHTDHVSYIKRTFGEMKAGGQLDFPTLSVALQSIRRLEEAGRHSESVTSYY